MGKEAIILAGGMGTRLRNAVPGLPKCMAPVAGKPFLYYVIANLQQQGVDSFILSLGYLHEIIEEYINNECAGLTVQYATEMQPLGTGGAIRHACAKAGAENVIVVNGDTLYKIDAAKLFSFHEKERSACTLVLKPMQDFQRYGVVEIDGENHIQSFKEKQFYEHGLINGGVYALQVNRFLSLGLPQKFSFEKDYLEKYYRSEKIMGLVQDEYFIDIGIPEDLAKANVEFVNMKI